ncbi:MAG: hypothetical protein AAF558_00505 [Verrucomicrobiota bacterium]
MPELSESPTRRRLRPKTYSIGLYIVGIFILLELVALFLIFWIRQEVKIDTKGRSLAMESEANSGYLLDLAQNAKPQELGLPNLPKPQIEARLDLDLQQTPQLDIAKLNEDARRFRREGDFILAEAALTQALEIDPNNVLTLTNKAMLEEAKNNTEGALRAWKKVIQAGEAEGGTTVQLARERAKIIEERFRLDEEARKRDSPLKDSRRLIVVSNVKMDPEPLPESPVEISQSITLKRNSETGDFQVNKIRIQLYFYELTPENRLIAADIDARFVNNPPEWKENGAEEVLKTTYLKTAADKGQRSYYGYLIRVYYEDELQDERAEPARLLRLFPVDTP